MSKAGGTELQRGHVNNAHFRKKKNAALHVVVQKVCKKEKGSVKKDTETEEKGVSGRGTEKEWVTFLILVL